MDQIVARRLQFDRFTLDLTRGCVRVGGREVDLPPKAFDVLRLLAENAGRLVSKQKLYDAVWPGVIVTDESLVQRIRELRQVLGDDDHSLIKTVSRRGYLLNATLMSPPSRSGELATLPPTATQPASVPPEPGRVPASRRWRWAAATSLACAVFGLAVLLFQWPALVGMVEQPNGIRREPALASALPASRVKTLKMQSSWPASWTLQDNFRFFAERVEKLTGGSLKIEALAGGQIVPPFEILEASHKKVIDGGHSISYYWVGKHKAAMLFSATPAGIAGMDQVDFMGWIYDGGGLELWWDLYQKELKLNLVVFPIMPVSPQPLGWFERAIKDLADFKGMKCRQTGIVAEIYKRMGMQTVNLQAHEIVPSALGGVIDCAEWIGGVEDLRLGLSRVWKYHYTPGMNESATVGELIINSEVWASLTPQQQEAIRSAVSETFIRWWAKWQLQNADAIKEMTERHGTQLLRTPPDVLIGFFKAWDEIAAEESAKNPFFKKVLDSQRAYAAKVVPAKRFMLPPYSSAGNHYWPESTR